MDLAALRTLETPLRRWAHWRRSRGSASSLPEGPWEPRPVQLYRFLFDPIPFLRSCAERYGGPFTMRIGDVPPIVFFFERDAIKEVFTSSPDALHAGKANVVLRPFLGEHSLLLLDGRRHLAQRRLLLPPFRGERMRAYGESIGTLTERRMRRWELGRTWPMQRETQRITLDVILRTVFGMEEGPEEARLRTLLQQTLGILDNPVYMVSAAQRDVGPLTPWGRFLRCQAEAHALLDALIRRRRQEDPSERDDILSMLLLATHEDGSPMGIGEIRDELMTLLIAGHETTATALSWAVHRLSVHPQLRRRAQAEIDDEGDPLGNLPFLEAFCRETLRMHPVIPGVGRMLQVPQRIAGHDLPAGVMVGCNVYLTHHNPRLWPEPERFDPERFVGWRPNPYSYLPFGGGVRRCIGEAFALFEMRVVLACMLSRAVPEPAGGPVKTVRRNITLSPAGGLPIRWRARNEEAALWFRRSA